MFSKKAIDWILSRSFGPNAEPPHPEFPTRFGNSAARLLVSSEESPDVDEVLLNLMAVTKLVVEMARLYDIFYLTFRQ